MRPVSETVDAHQEVIKGQLQRQPGTQSTRRKAGCQPVQVTAVQLSSTQNGLCPRYVEPDLQGRFAGSRSHACSCRTASRSHSTPSPGTSMLCAVASASFLK